MIDDVGGSESTSPLVREAWSVLDEIQDVLCHRLREPWPNRSPGAVPDRMADLKDGELALWFELDGRVFLRLDPISVICTANHMCIPHRRLCARYLASRRRTACSRQQKHKPAVGDTPKAAV